MLQVEASSSNGGLSILCLPGNKGKVVYLTSATNLKFIKKIKPNTRLNINTKIKSFKRGIALCEGKGMIDENLACKAEFSLILPDEINKYKLK